MSPEELAEATITVVSDAIADGRPETAARLLLDAFDDPRLGATLEHRGVIKCLLLLWRLSMPEARRAQAGFERWLERHPISVELPRWLSGQLALERALAKLADEFPAAVVAILVSSIVDGEIDQLKPRLRRWAWANPEPAALATSLMPEPSMFEDLLGRSSDPLRAMIGEALAIPPRGTRPLPPEQAIARARQLIAAADGPHFQAEAWRALHDLLFEQTVETSAAVVDAIEPLLANWPDSVRVTLAHSPWDFDVVVGVEEPAHRLIRSLDYSWVFVGRNGKIMIRNPRLDSRDGLCLARSSSARWLTRIDLDRQPLGPDVGEALGRSANFERLERLMLSGCELGTRGVVALANGNFASLTHVVLSHNAAGPLAAHAWGDFCYDRAKQLSLLDLSDNPIAEGVRGLADAAVDELRLSSCQLVGAQLPEFHARALILDQNPLGPEVEIRGPRLRELSLCEVELQDEGAARLALPQLERINLEANRITASGLARCSVGASSWELSRNPIGDDGFAAVVGRPGCRRLIARACGLSSACFEGATLGSIEVLDLLDNEIDDIRALARARALRDLTLGPVSLGDIGEDWPPLESLAVFGPFDDDRLPGVIPSKGMWLNESHLDDRLLLELLGNEGWRPDRLAIAATTGIGDDLQAFGRLTDAAVVALANSPVAERLGTLRLTGHAGITSEGLLALARSPYLARLERLDLQHCSIDDAGVVEFLRARPYVMLDVEGNPVGDEAEAALDGASENG